MGEPAERGAGALLVVVLVVVMLIAAAVAATAIAVAGLRHRASAAADLAALAGAQAVRQSADACSAAGRVAAANGARLAACHQSGEIVEVVVEVTSPRLWGRRWTLSARARAGPAGAALTPGEWTGSALSRRCRPPPEVAGSPCGGSAPSGSRP